MYVALAIGLAGMALILVPGLLLEGVKLSAAGLFCGWAAGVMYAVYLLFAKSLRGLNVRSTPVVFTQSAFTAAVMLVPGLLAVSAAHYHYTGIDLLMAALLGLVTTAFSFSLFMDGLHYIRVQHAGIIAYVEPVSAPLYALRPARPGAELVDDRRRGADRRRGHPGGALRPRRARAGAAGMSGRRAGTRVRSRPSARAAAPSQAHRRRAAVTPSGTRWSSPPTCCSA